jgi:hypothetical protein
MKATAQAAPMDDYQAQDDMRTLTRAEEIKADAKRHGKAMSHGKQQMSALQNVVGEGAADAAADKKEKGGPAEGSKAEEAEDKKEAKMPAMPMGKVAQRAPKANKASVI